jgi:membrane-associated phospholipid phosphatase
VRHAARLVTILGPDGFVTGVALLGLGALVTALGGELRLSPDGMAPLFLFAALLLITALARSPLLLSDRPRFLAEQLRAARAWAPFVLVYVAYRLLITSMNRVTGAGVEDRLKALDEVLLGMSPSFWMQGLVSPWLTELMAYAYALMFVLPLVLMLLLDLRERREEFRVVGVSLLAAFYLGLLLYLIVPARSPRLVYAYDVPLSGVFGLYELSTFFWDRLQTVQYDAFPSLHTAVSTIALAWAWRHGDALSRRRPLLLFAVYLPHVVALQLSTLYLRQHYFVDLLGGWALAVAVLWVSPRIVAAAGRVAAFAPRARAAACLGTRASPRGSRPAGSSSPRAGAAWSRPWRTR